MQATRGYGADVILHGSCVEDALGKALAFAERTEAVFIHPYDHPDIVARQGTDGLPLPAAGRPGSLAKLLADLGANVLEVGHERLAPRLNVGEVEVVLQVETRGPEHLGRGDRRAARRGLHAGVRLIRHLTCSVAALQVPAL